MAISYMELDHILESLNAIHIHRICEASRVKVRNRAARTRFRRRKTRDYFMRAPLFTFVAEARNAGFFCHARLFSHDDRSQLGTIIGLNRYTDTIGLGFVLQHSAGSVTFISPVKSTKSINRVVFGDTTI